MRLNTLACAITEIDQFKPFPNKPWFLCVCSTSLLKTPREKEKLLVTSNFSFSHSVFYPFSELSAIFIKFKIVVCKLFQFRSLKFVVWERVKKISVSTKLQYNCIKTVEGVHNMKYQYFLHKQMDRQAHSNIHH